MDNGGAEPDETNRLERADLFGLSSEGQHCCMAGLNLLAAIVTCRNTAHLDEAVRQPKHAGMTIEPDLLAHISPLGWAHILFTNEYRWQNADSNLSVRFCRLPESTRIATAQVCDDI